MRMARDNAHWERKGGARLQYILIACFILFFLFYLFI